MIPMRLETTGNPTGLGKNPPKMHGSIGSARREPIREWPPARSKCLDGREFGLGMAGPFHLAPH